MSINQNQKKTTMNQQNDHNDMQKSEKNSESMTQSELRKLIEEFGYDHVMSLVKSMKPVNELDEDEPILDKKNHKFTTFPIHYQNVWQLYKEQIACFWKASEIDLSNDYDDFMTLNDNEKYFVEMILAFFAAQDGIVNMNLSERFTTEIQITEIVMTYQWQTMMENVHSETYSLMLDNIVKDPVRREFLFNAMTNIPAVKAMADWALKWVTSDKSFAHRVLAFAVVEGVFFSGAFAAIYWLKTYKNKNRGMAKGKPFMDGLTKSNKFIQRDEGLHCKFAALIYSLLKKKLSENEVKELVDEGVKLAQDFMIHAIPVKLIGMNNEDMCDYIEYIGDRLLNGVGYSKIYNKKNPFKFMELIGMTDKTNFFETRPHEYQDAYVMNTGNKSKITINEDDF